MTAATAAVEVIDLAEVRRVAPFETAFGLINAEYDAGRIA